MLKVGLKWTLAISLTVMSLESALAECSTDPRPYLSPDITFDQTSEVMRLAYASVMSREEFDERKKRGTLTAFIPQIKTSVDLGFDDFKQSIRREAEAKSLNFNTDNLRTILTSKVSALGVEAFKACLNSNDRVGLSAIVDEDSFTSEEFFLALTWRGGVGNPEGTFDVQGSAPFEVLGGEVIGSFSKEFPQKIRSGQTLRIAIKRDLNRNFAFSSSVNGYSAVAKLPPQPRNVYVVYDNVQSNAIEARTNHENGYADPTPKACWPNAGDTVLGPNDVFLPTTAHVVEEEYVGEDRGRVWSQIDEAATNQKRVCWAVHSQVSKKGIAAVVRAHVDVIRQRIMTVQN